MKLNIFTKSALILVALVVVFTGAWIAVDATELSLNVSSIIAEAGGGCGGCGGGGTTYTVWVWGYIQPQLDGGGGGGGGSYPSCTLGANPGTITPGQSSTLSWNTMDVTTVSIDNGVGSVATNGSVSVSPSVTTTYTLTGNGPFGLVTCQQTVIVTQPPTPVCSADLSKDRLIWSTVNATSVTINTLTAGSPVIPAPYALSG